MYDVLLIIFRLRYVDHADLAVADLWDQLWLLRVRRSSDPYPVSVSALDLTDTDNSEYEANYVCA
jgi:hypothetical protein